MKIELFQNGVPAPLRKTRATKNASLQTAYCYAQAIMVIL